MSDQSDPDRITAILQKVFQSGGSREYLDEIRTPSGDVSPIVTPAGIVRLLRANGVSDDEIRAHWGAGFDGKPVDRVLELADAPPVRVPE